MSKFTRSWLLFKASLSVMMRNRQLLVFPIVTFVLTTFIVLFFLVPVTLRPTGYSYLSGQHWAAISHSLFMQTTDANGHTEEVLSPFAIGYLIVMYFLSMFFATFFNVAFYHEILAALNGDSVSISRGLRFAVTRWKAILLWTIFAGIVGLIIKQIEERAGIIGSIIGRFIGIAWSVASVFVIPLIVQGEESVNPIKTLKNSALILKRTWGEALIGYIGISLASGIVGFISIGVMVAVIVVSTVLQNFWILAVIAPIWLLTMIAVSYLTSIAGQVFKGALYLYAANGVVVEPFNREMLDSAWKFKKQ